MASRDDFTKARRHTIAMADDWCDGLEEDECYKVRDSLIDKIDDAFEKAWEDIVK
jgi:hypothetical protein